VFGQIKFTQDAGSMFFINEDQKEIHRSSRRIERRIRRQDYRSLLTIQNISSSYKVFLLLIIH